MRSHRDSLEYLRRPTAPPPSHCTSGDAGSTITSKSHRRELLDEGGALKISAGDPGLDFLDESDDGSGLSVAPEMMMKERALAYFESVEDRFRSSRSSGIAGLCSLLNLALTCKAMYKLVLGDLRGPANLATWVAGIGPEVDVGYLGYGTYSGQRVYDIWTHTR